VTLLGLHEYLTLTSINLPPSNVGTNIFNVHLTTMPDERSEKQAAAQQAVDILHEISTILVSSPISSIYKLVR
jgi:hypothetical protein